MHPTPLGQKRKKPRLAGAVLAACAPFPAFAAEVGSTAWFTTLLFAIVAIVVIVLLLHEALEEDRFDGDDDHANDAPGMPRFVHARHKRSSDHARRPHA